MEKKEKIAVLLSLIATTLSFIIGNYNYTFLFGIAFLTGSGIWIYKSYKMQ